MGVACVIGPGEREWFRRCRRAWDLGSPNRRNWERRDARPPDLAMAVRQALAVWYFPGMWEWPRPIVLPRALQAFDEAVAAKGGRPAPDEHGIRSVRRMLERYFVWAPTVDAFAPVRVEADFEANIPDPRTPGHDLVDGQGRAVRYQDRLHLLVVDRNDAYWVVEHRLTQDGWADRDELFLAERPVTAAWGWEQFYCMVIAGTVHNELRLVDESEAPGAGELAETAVARRPRPRDWARSRFAGRRTDERDDVVVEDGGGWFRRTWVPRRRAELDAVADHLFGEAVEMLDVGVGLYPSPAPEHCSRCDYRLPCIAMNRGTNVDGVLADAYRRREPDRPEEGRLGGGTWSMNRGAAPPPQWRRPPP